MKLAALRPEHHGRPIGYRYGCRCWACGSAHADDLRKYRRHGAKKDRINVTDSANMTLLELIASLPLGEPHVLTPHEQGEHDGYHGLAPTSDARAYLAGYALGCGERAELRRITREKSARDYATVPSDHHAATYSPKVARDQRA